LWPHPTDSFKYRHQGEFTLVDSNSERGTADHIGCAEILRRTRVQTEDYVIEKTAKGWVIASRGDCILICARRKAAEVAVRTAALAAHEHAVAVTLLFAEAAPGDGSSEMTHLSSPQSMIA
jgi:hypothetical protein